MDTFIFHVQALIIALILGFPLSLALKIKKPIIIALIIVGLYVILALCFIKLHLNATQYLSLIPSPNPTPSIIPINNQLSSLSSTNTKSPVSLQNVNSTLSPPKGMASTTNEPTDDDDLPLDKLQPEELVKRLNYIYEQTASPVKVPVHSAEGTPYDTGLKDITLGTGVVPVKQPLTGFTEWLYPQLNSFQINTRDCTNFNSNDNRSCIQRPDWNNGFPLKNCPTTTLSPTSINNYKEAMKQSLLLAGINNGVEHQMNNDNLIEKFSSSMNMDNYGWNENPDNRPSALSINEAINNTLYKNTPINSINSLNISKNLCRNCKTGVCKNDICD